MPGSRTASERRRPAARPTHRGRCAHRGTARSLVPGLAHDLRNALNTIALVTSVLERRQGQAVADVASPLVQSVAAARRDIDDLVDVLEIDAGRLRPEDERVDMARFLEELVAGHRRLARRGGKRVELALDPDLPESAVFDRSRVKRISGRLLALFAAPGPAERRVRVIGRAAEAGAAEIVLEPDADGAPDGEPLLAPTLTLDHELRVARVVLHGLGARLVQDEGRERLGVRIVLPAPSDGIPDAGGTLEEAALERRTLADEWGLDELNVLIVDDDPGDRRRVRRHLERGRIGRFRSEEQVTFEAALAALRRNEHHVCLLDFKLGTEDGLALLRRALREGVSTPIIMLTGVTSYDVDLAAMQCGAVDFLGKAELSPDLLERSIRYAMKQRELETRLREMARRDPLTGLANRRALRHALDRALEHTRGTGRLVAVLFVDLDGFKPINDRLGHEAGDEVLIVVGRRLRKGVRQTDTVARIGGDEFAVVCEDLERPEDAAAIGRKIGDLLDRQMEIHGVTIEISSSIGLAFGALPVDEPKALLARADRAMYEAKSAKHSGKRRSRLVVADGKS